MGAFRSALRSADSDKSDSDGFDGFLSWVCIMGSYRGFVSLLLGFLAGVIFMIIIININAININIIIIMIVGSTPNSFRKVCR